MVDQGPNYHDMRQERCYWIRIADDGSRVALAFAQHNSILHDPSNRQSNVVCFRAPLVSGTHIPLSMGVSLEGKTFARFIREAAALENVMHAKETLRQLPCGDSIEITNRPPCIDIHGGRMRLIFFDRDNVGDGTCSTTFIMLTWRKRPKAQG